jgi:AcrR family transcriptional regulator
MRGSNLSVSGKLDGRTALSQETRKRLIRAAIEVFGRLGFEGASTRALMEQAGANLAAIPYHFGGKHGLYLAAAQEIADYARERIEPIITRLADAARAAPMVRIDEALSDFIHLLVGGPEPKEWVTFFIRCEHEGDAAFRLIFDAAIAPFNQALTQTVMAVPGSEAADERLPMQIAVLLTSIINLRTLQNMLLRSLGWNELNPSRVELLSAQIRRVALRELHPRLAGPEAGI